MNEITMEELASCIAALPTGQQFTFNATNEGESYGVTRLKFFSSDMVVLNYFGGGNPFVIEAQWSPGKDVTPAIQHGLCQYLEYREIEHIYVYDSYYPRYSLNKLLSRQALTEMLQEGGSNGLAMNRVREYYDDVFRCDQILRYSVPQGTSYGGFIVPVKEGYLFIPYDKVDANDQEILQLDGAFLMDADDCEYMARECSEYSKTLVGELYEMAEEVKHSAAQGGEPNA